VNRYADRFDISGKTVVVTGGAGLLGQKHAEGILEGKGIPVLLDISEESIEKTVRELKKLYPDGIVESYKADITDRASLEYVCTEIEKKYGNIYGLINNAANNPKIEGGSKNLGATKFVDFPLDMWNQDLNVGITGAFLCAQVFGKSMEKFKKGVIINIGSDYGVIAPDQRVYRKEGMPEEQQIIKPVSYSVVKHAMIGLTKYLAVYWAEKGIRVNTLCPASLSNGQNEEFVKKLSTRIPMGRMSRPDEYPATVLYMLSEASSYMTGATVILDGGRTSW